MPSYRPPLLQLDHSLREKGFVTVRKITVSDVENLLLQLNSRKAGGPDDINPLELKVAARKIIPSVTSLFNISLSSGQLPKEFKTANITPLLKPDKNDTKCT